MIQYQEVDKILKEKKIKYPEFGFLNVSGSVIKIFQWQPKGILSFNQQKGFWCAEEAHISKAKKFMKEAYVKKADIVITPEYCFPWSVIENIIEEKDLYPRKGKLYCLGMEGISCENLSYFIQKYEAKEDLCIITEKLDDLNENYFYSCLLYMFVSDEKLICVIQLKTTPASDKWAELESAGLTRGRTVYLFKSMRSEFYLLSFICADVLNQEIESIKSEVSYQECIILHPQLNPAPLHETFEQMRRSFLNYDCNNIRIVGVNWARNTKLPSEGIRGEVKIKDSFSACYYNGKWEFSRQEDIELLKRNKSKGIDLAIKNHIIIWYMPENEHCMFYSIDGFHNHTLSNVTGKHKEPLGDTYYEYDVTEKLWKSATICKTCRIDWEWLNSSFGLEKCSNGECKIDLLYHFFHILLIGRKNYDFTLEEEKVQTIFNREENLSEDLMALRMKSTYPDKALKSGNIPPRFAKLADENYEWILDIRGNLKEKNTLDIENICSVIYVDSEVEELIKRYINRFQTYMSEAACDRLIVYYLSSAGIRYYEKHYNNEINNPNNCNSMNNIK